MHNVGARHIGSPCAYSTSMTWSPPCLMDVVLSQKRGTLTNLIPISRNKSIWNSKSFAASYMAINSACAELVAGMLCSLLFQLVGPQEYEMYPEVDFLPEVSFGFIDIFCPAQSESEKPISLTLPLHSLPSYTSSFLGFFSNIQSLFVVVSTVTS